MATLDSVTKQAITNQLRIAIEEMRKLESPGEFCSLGRQGLPDNIFWTDDPEQLFAVPFNTEAELNEAMVAKYRKIEFSNHRADWYTRAFEAVLENHKPVFSHSDFQRKNIMVRSLQNANANEGSELQSEVVIID